MANITSIAPANRNPEDTFLAAWKDAVRLIGKSYFKGNPDTAMYKEELAPHFDLFKARLGTASSGERLFMLACYQFYNDIDFKTKRPSLADLAYSLDEQRLSVLARLMRSYRGW